MKAANFCSRVAVTFLFLWVCGSAAVADDQVEIMHDGIHRASVGDRIPISVTINDPRHSIETVRTFFKTRLDDRFYFVVMEKTRGKTYTGVLPAPLRGSERLEYVILAKSTSDQIVRTRRYVVDVDDKRTIARLD
jgi:hypothetical protein